MTLAARLPAEEKLSVRALTAADSARIRIDFTIPPGSSRATVNVWERFGKRVAEILDEREPASGDRTVEWDTGERSGIFIVRATVDDDSESQIVDVPRP